jgi:UDP-N-acetylglucosamine:LPS N-acetylglucosamine transferase
MSEYTPKILILSSDTGGGHRSAAQAIAEGVERFWHGESSAVRILKAVEGSHHITEKLVRFYNWMLRHRQHHMKYLYWMVNKFRPEKSDFFFKRCAGFCREQFEKWCPHVVVSVHPLTQHLVARILKELGLSESIPLVTVVTDPGYGFWKGWACDDVSLYLVANEDAKQQLVDYGVSPEKIKISGMPVHPKFTAVDEEDAKEARRHFGLDPDKFTVFVNAGWVGGGNIPQIFRELIRGDLDVQAIFLAGKNEELRIEAEGIAANASFPVKVIGYSDDVERLMHSANVMISKLGGLTIFEALACRLPIIADATTRPMPQEAGTANLLVKEGAGIILERSSDLVPILKSLISDKVKYSEMKSAALRLGFPDATKTIIEEITKLIPDPRLAEHSA